MRLYLAGPLFTAFERAGNRALAEALRRGRGDLEVVLPQEFPVPPGESEPWPRLYAACVEGLGRADVVLALLEGADADSGTSWEVGYACGLGKPVIGVRTDNRECQESGVNVMLARSCAEFIRLADGGVDASRLAAAVLEALERLFPRREGAGGPGKGEGWE